MPTDTDWDWDEPDDIPAAEDSQYGCDLEDRFNRHPSLTAEERNPSLARQ